MGAAYSPETGCVGERACATCDKYEEGEEFLYAVAHSSSEERRYKPQWLGPPEGKVNALPALTGDSEFVMPLMPIPGFPMVVGDCGADSCAGDRDCWSKEHEDADADDDVVYRAERVPYAKGSGAKASGAAKPRSLQALPALSENHSALPDGTDALPFETPAGPPVPLEVEGPTMPVVSEGQPLAEGVELLSPELTNDLLRTRKCVLIDVRGADRASGVIEGAIHVPAISVNEPFAARLPELVQRFKHDRLVIFFCQFCKHRAPHCANLYREQNDSMQRVAILEGGFRAWQALGLPVQDGGGTPYERATADAWALHQGNIVCRVRNG